MWPVMGASSSAAWPALGVSSPATRTAQGAELTGILPMGMLPGDVASHGGKIPGGAADPGGKLSPATRPTMGASSLVVWPVLGVSPPMARLGQVAELPGSAASSGGEAPRRCG